MQSLKFLIVFCLFFFNFYTTTNGLSVADYKNAYTDSIELATVDRKRFTLSTKKMNFYQAERFCTLNGGFLAAIETKEENDAIIKYAHGNRMYWQKNSIWVGGTRQGEVHDKKNFYWLKTGRPVSETFTYWKDVEPNNGNNQEQCISLAWHYNFEWNDDDCTALGRVMCEFSTDPDESSNSDESSVSNTTSLISKLLEVSFIFGRML